jgi:hypothetical protein
MHFWIMLLAAIGIIFLGALSAHAILLSYSPIVTGIPSNVMIPIAGF